MSWRVGNGGWLAPACLALALALGCERGEEVAADAAKAYYETLFSGDSEGFVRGICLPDTVPESFLEQLGANARMYVARMVREHHGVYEVRVLNCEEGDERDAHGKVLYRTANAFLVFCCGDSLNEEVVVPMVWRDGKWLMR